MILRRKCLYSEFFWSVFPRIRTEYGPEKLTKNIAFLKFFFPVIFLNFFVQSAMSIVWFVSETLENNNSLTYYWLIITFQKESSNYPEDIYLVKDSNKNT